MENLRLKTVATACAIAALALAGLGTAPADAQQRLTAAIHDIPPFGGPTPSGYCFDLLNTLAARTGMTVEFRPMPVAAMIPAVADGSIDTFCSPMGKSGGPPADSVAWVGPIALSREILLTRTSDQAAYKTLQDVSSLRVGTVQGTSYVALATSKGGITDLKTYANLVQGLTALSGGEIDVFLGAEPLFRYQQKVLGKWPDIRAVDSYVSIAEYHPALGVLESNAELIGVLQPALDGMIEDGTLQKLLDVWALPVPLP